jgi:hypothetical protein
MRRFKIYFGAKELNGGNVLIEKALTVCKTQKGKKVAPRNVIGCFSYAIDSRYETNVIDIHQGARVLRIGKSVTNKPTVAREEHHRVVKIP